MKPLAAIAVVAAVSYAAGLHPRSLTVVKISVLRGNPDGTFQPRVDFSVDDGPWSVAIADFADIGSIELVPPGQHPGDGPCLPDVIADGILDFFDYLEFQNRFDAGDLTMDFTADGVLDGFDFAAFQAAFAEGCD